MLFFLKEIKSNFEEVAQIFELTRVVGASKHYQFAPLVSFGSVQSYKSRRDLLLQTMYGKG